MTQESFNLIPNYKEELLRISRHRDVLDDKKIELILEILKTVIGAVEASKLFKAKLGLDFDVKKGMTYEDLARSIISPDEMRQQMLDKNNLDPHTVSVMAKIRDRTEESRSSIPSNLAKAVENVEDLNSKNTEPDVKVGGWASKWERENDK